MDKLKQYLAETGVKQSNLAKEVGTSRGYFHDIVAGRRKPSLALASRIDKATNGKVPLSAWADNRGAA